MAPGHLEDNDVHYAYQGIHHFFDVYSLPCALQYMESALRAATSVGIWKKEEPFNLLYYMEQTDTLCSAVFSIFYNHAERPGAITGNPADEPGTGNTGNFHDNSSVWNNPRSLTVRQYQDPYKAIKKFCNYMAPPGWKKFFKEVLESALTKAPGDLYISYDLLKARLRVLQMLEACHLIHMRTWANTGRK